MHARLLECLARGAREIPQLRRLWGHEEVRSMMTKSRITRSAKTESKIKPPDQGTAMLRARGAVDSKIKPPDQPSLSARRHPAQTKPKRPV